ncbi:hypothetical protein [Neobacillus niacini]|uniref:hypothetical protein n=1 Tax=Neobacillus niacini TaxID=86668 RepID=UPI002FFE8274
MNLTLFMVEDEGLSNVLKYFLFLQQCTEDIIDNSSFTFEDILYSQYYWFVMFKNQFFSSFGYDGGMNQQAFLLLEKICNEQEGNVDWDVIEDIENTIAE